MLEIGKETNKQTKKRNEKTKPDFIFVPEGENDLLCIFYKKMCFVYGSAVSPPFLPSNKLMSELCSKFAIMVA